MKFFLSNKYLITFLVIVFNIPVLSQESLPNDSLDTPITLNEVTLSANRVAESKLKISQHISSIPLNEIKFQNIQNTADLLSSTGKLTVQKSQQGGGSPVIRGFEASRILLVVDGIRMNNLIYRAGHLQNIITVDENILRLLEVNYGSSSTVYGSDALGGSIHLHTLNPYLQSELGRSVAGNAMIRYGSVNNEKKLHLDWTLAGKKFSSLSSISIADYDNLLMGKNVPKNKEDFGQRLNYIERINGIDSVVTNNKPHLQKFSAYSQLDAMQKFLYQPNDNNTHILNVQYSTSTNIPRYDRLTDLSNDILRFAEWYYGPQKRLLAAYHWDRKNCFLGHQLFTNIAYQYNEESRHQRRFRKDELQHRKEAVNMFSINMGLHKKIHRWDLRYGLEVVQQFLMSQAHEENIVTEMISPLDTRYPDGTNAMINTDVYGTASYKLDEKTNVNIGLRMGYNAMRSSMKDTSFFSFPFTEIKQQNPTYSGSLGIVLLPVKGMKISANIGTGFRVPNIDDLAKIFESGAGTIILPNENLKPEKTITPELGLHYHASSRFNMETAVFYTWFMDAIVTMPFTYNGQDSILYDGSWSQVMANQNQRNAFLTGLHASAEYNPIAKLWMSGTLHYTYGRIVSQEDNTTMPLDHISPMSGRLGIRWQDSRYTIDCYSLMNGKKSIDDYLLNGEDNEQYAPPDGTPAWFTLNIKTSFKAHKNIIIQAGIENIMDRQYRTFASGINAPGRNIFGTIRFKW